MTRPAPRTAEIPRLTREALVVPGSLREDDRSIEVVWTTGAEVRRLDWFTGETWIEALSLDPKHVRLRRLNSGSPVLKDHNPYEQVGKVERDSVRLEGGKGCARLRFSRRQDPVVEGIWQDIKDGIREKFSVGYDVLRYEEERDQRGKLIRRIAVDWEPGEISTVSIPADIDAETIRGQRASTPKNPCVFVTRGVTMPSTAAPTTPASAPLKKRMSAEEKVSLIQEILAAAGLEEEKAKSAAMEIALKLSEDKPAEEAPEAAAAGEASAEMGAVVEAARKATGVQELRDLPVALEVLAESVKTRASRETAEKRAQRQREVDQAIAALELQPHRRDWGLGLSEESWAGFRQRSAPIADAAPVEAPAPRSAKPGPATPDPKGVINDQMRAYCQKRGLDLDLYAAEYAKQYPGEAFVDATAR
jgi:hypothetical protein